MRKINFYLYDIDFLISILLFWSSVFLFLFYNFGSDVFVKQKR